MNNCFLLFLNKKKDNKSKCVDCESSYRNKIVTHEHGYRDP